MHRDPSIQLAAEQAGGITKLSLALGLSRTAVSGWRRVPAERVLAVEAITGVSRYTLRPDIYPDRRGEDRSAQQCASNGRHERRGQMR